MPARAVFMCFFKLSREPKWESMDLAREPEGGSPPPWALGARFSQKRVWLVWPPKRRKLGRGLGRGLGGRFFFSLTSVEVDEGLDGDLGLDVAFLLGFLEFFELGVVGGYVGVVVFGVVEFHDLA